MVTPEEIQHRVEQEDAFRSAKRSAAAQQVGRLAQRRAAIVEQLSEIERELGDVLAAAREVMDIDELARFTDIPVADLTRWFEARTTSRPKRKKPAGASGRKPTTTSRGSGAARTTPAGKASTPPQTTTVRAGAVDKPAHGAAEVT